LLPLIVQQAVGLFHVHDRINAHENMGVEDVVIGNVCAEHCQLKAKGRVSGLIGAGIVIE
jgi:hypothetical protein